MSVQESQGGYGNGGGFSTYGELCERARKNAAEIEAREAAKAEKEAAEKAKAEKEKEKKGKGLEFMAYKLCVARKHIELSVTKKITPAESNLLRLLEIGTIGAQNSRGYICSKAEFYITDLSVALGYKEKDKIWKILKSLHKKQYIIREKTRTKDREVLGLNPAVFEQILIDKQHETDKKRHLKLAVDNTTSGVDNDGNDVDKSGGEPPGLPTNHPGTTDEPSAHNRRTVGCTPTNRLVFTDESSVVLVGSL
jgi:hypothetical protein